MATQADIQREIEILKQLEIMDAQESMSDFVLYTNESYTMKQFHKIVCDYLDLLLKREIKKLMIFIPPQHGKSELSSRRFPSFALGRDPKEKIGICSYSATVASKFNRDIQMIMDDEKYLSLFPDTRLNSKRVSTETKNGVLRNSEIFEVVKHRGFVKTVGVGGSLTSTTLDIGIIDDPFKDRAEANSLTIRNKVWDWYQDVFCTRLHNDSIQLMLFTRWHEDDLAGRILDPNNPFYDAEEASQWTVIAIPAIKEEFPPLDCAVKIDDGRKIGEALWEERHSKEKFERMERINPLGYASLAQQRPAPLEGDMIKEEWFTILKPNELPFNMDSVTWDLWIDGAWTKKETDKKKKANNPDDTGISYTYFDKKNKNLYIRCVNGVKKEIKELVNYLDSHAYINGATSQSKVNIEMKASGFAIKPLLHERGYNTIKIDNKHVSLGKFNRVEQCEPFLASGRVFLIQDKGTNWIPTFLAQCTAFPNGANDDLVDVLTYPILKHFVKAKRQAQTNYIN